MNTKTNGYFIGTAILLLLASGCASTKQAKRALLDWEVGTAFTYELTQEQSQVIEIPGQGVQENTSNVVMDLSVVSTGPYQFTITVTDAEATGSPISVEPLKGLESAVVTDNKGTITSASGLADNEYIKAQGGEARFLDDLQQIFQTLPDEPLAPGVSWIRETSLPFSQQGLNITRTVTERYICKELTTFNGTSAYQIDVTSEVEMSGGGNQGGQEMDITMNGNFEGTVFIDAVTGALLSSEQTGNLVGVIDMEAASLPMSIDLSVSVKIAE